jgi:hypothetical protein
MLVITVQGLPTVHGITLRNGYKFDTAGTVSGVKRNLFAYIQIKKSNWMWYVEISGTSFTYALLAEIFLFFFQQNLLTSFWFPTLKFVSTLNKSSTRYVCVEWIEFTIFILVQQFFSIPIPVFTFCHYFFVTSIETLQKHRFAAKPLLAAKCFSNSMLIYLIPRVTQAFHEVTQVPGIMPPLWLWGAIFSSGHQSCCCH